MMKITKQFGKGWRTGSESREGSNFANLKTSLLSIECILEIVPKSYIDVMTCKLTLNALEIRIFSSEIPIFQIDGDVFIYSISHAGTYLISKNSIIF